MSIVQAVTSVFKARDKDPSLFPRMGKKSKKFGETTSKAFKKAGKSASSTGKIIKGILGAGLITKALSGVSAGLTEVTAQFIGFDDAVTAASAKFKGLNLATKEGQQTLLDLKKAARETGKLTKFSAVEAAQGLDFYATAGFNAKQAMAVLLPTAKLATIANLDLARTSDIASDSLGAFGLMTDDSTQLQKNFTRVSDVMARTMTSTNTNMEDMFESIKKGAPTFTATGQSIETFNALMGVMANSGVKGAESGTQLRNMMLRLAKPTDEAQQALDQMGIVTRDSKGDFIDIIKILGQFEKGLEGKGKAEKAAALKTIFGVRSITGLNLLLQEGSTKLEKFRGELIKSGGATKDMADVMDKSLGNRLKSLKSAAIEVGFSLLSAFQDQGISAIDTFTKFIRNIDTKPLIEGIKNTVKFLGQVFTKFKEIGERTGLFSGISSGIKPFIEIIKSVPKLVINILDEFIKIGKQSGMFDSIKKAMENVKPIFNTFKDIFKTIWGFMKDTGVLDLLGKAFGVLAKAVGPLVKIFGMIWESLSPLFGKMETVLGPFIRILSALLTGLGVALDKLDAKLSKKPIVNDATSLKSAIKESIKFDKQKTDILTNSRLGTIKKDKPILSTDREENLDLFFGEKRQPPGRLTPQQNNVNVKGSIDINNAPAGTTAEVEEGPFVLELNNMGVPTKF